MVRAARAMVTATRAAGDDEGEGVEEGDEDEEGDGDGDMGGGRWVTKRAMATAAGAMATVAEVMAMDTDVNNCRFFSLWGQLTVIFSIRNWGTRLNIVSGLVTIKHQLKQTGFHPSWSTFLRYCVVSKKKLGF